MIDPNFVSHRPILTEQDKQILDSLSQLYSLERFRVDARNYEEMTVDFVYTSAKIEGNTYDRIDADNLLRIGITAGGKRWSDAVMLINLREGFERVMGIGHETVLDLDYLFDLHKVLMKDLLPAREQGLVRMTGVNIGATDYKPLADPARLHTELQFILPTAEQYQDPFEQAIYLHCNLAYLQYFRDGNKRSARMMQTAALVRSNALPLFFSDTLIDTYRRATIHYCETGNYTPYVSFFKENYRLVIGNLLGHEPSF